MADEAQIQAQVQELMRFRNEQSAQPNSQPPLPPPTTFAPDTHTQSNAHAPSLPFPPPPPASDSIPNADSVVVDLTSDDAPVLPPFLQAKPVPGPLPNAKAQTGALFTQDPAFLRNLSHEKFLQNQQAAQYLHQQNQQQQQQRQFHSLLLQPGQMAPSGGPPPYPPPPPPPLSLAWNGAPVLQSSSTTGSAPAPAAAPHAPIPGQLALAIGMWHANTNGNLSHVANSAATSRSVTTGGNYPPQLHPQHPAAMRVFLERLREYQLHPNQQPPPISSNMESNLRTINSQLQSAMFRSHPPPQPPPQSITTEAGLRAFRKALESSGVKDGMMDPPQYLMDTILLPHQKSALAWMTRRENGTSQPFGGILADDQGLGKTVTTIALIVTNPRAGVQRVPVPLSSGEDEEEEDGDGDVVIVLDDDEEEEEKEIKAEEIVAAVKKVEAEAKETKKEEGGGQRFKVNGMKKLPSSVAIIEEEEEEVKVIEEGKGTRHQATAVKEEKEVIEVVGGEEEDDDDDDDDDDGRDDDGRDTVKPKRPPPTHMRSGGTNYSGSSTKYEFGTLVVCPTTLLHQWESEVRTKTAKTQRDKLPTTRVYVYHGKTKGVSAKVLSTFDVVITTYQTLVQEMPEGKKPVSKKGSASDIRLHGIEDLTGAGGVGAQKKRRRESETEEKGGQLFRVMWHRVVLDESQMIKNHRTLAAHAAWALRARRRWCLTGTPIQNSVDDLYAYFKFLRFEPYSKFSVFKELIKDPIAQDDPAAGYTRLKAILNAILRRRTKQSKDKDGNFLVPLQGRHVRLLQKEFTEVEREMYVRLDKEVAAQVKELEANASTRGNYVNMLYMLLRLRQACSHPHLVRKIGRTDTSHHHSAEVVAARKLKADVRSKLADTLRSGLTECVTCLDVPEDPVVSVCGHIFCRQCVSAQLSMAGQGAAESELAFHCPTCGDVLGANQTFGAEALDVKEEEGEDAGGAVSNGGALVRSDGSSTKIDALMELLMELKEPEVAGNGHHLGAKKKAKSGGGGGGGATTGPPTVKLRERVIVFSQWTSMLDLIEIPLRKACIEYRRLDGTMSATARQTAIQDFAHDPVLEPHLRKPFVSVMLVSLKAASVGLNLVCANHVVLMDLWYNPATEDQAIDRAHRIGQTKDVQVTRITIKNTIEDRILEMQERKKHIVDSALGTEVGGLNRERLGMEELLSMYRGGQKKEGRAEKEKEKEGGVEVVEEVEEGEGEEEQQ